MKKLLTYIALIVGALVFAYPFVWMVFATFKPEVELGELSMLPSQWTLASYDLVFNNIPIERSFLNSLIVVTAVTTSALVFGSMASYALAKL